MLQLTAVAGLVAGSLNLAALILYVLATFGWALRGNMRLHRVNKKTKPNRVAWGVWTVVGILISLTSLKSGATDTMSVPIVLAAGPLIVFLISIKHGEGGWTVWDKLCLVGAGVAGIVWFFTGSAPTALLLCIVADAFGVAAVVAHAYNKPQEESKIAWVVFLVGDVVNIFAVTDWSWSESPVWFYVVYMVAHTGIIVAILCRFSRNT
ncbi:hypothetical protein EXS57_00545 [Candidatus Kaiserbacteria bacterium]|nr:hypothetical protein [Candidatus Kaiserbacteria bacterium]